MKNPNIFNIVTPRQEESPKGVFMRHAHENQYHSMATVKTAFDSGDANLKKPELCGESVLAQELKAAWDERSIDYTSHFYQREGGATNNDNVLVHGLSVPHDWVHWSDLNVCPKCVRDSHRTLFYADLEFFKTCPVHQVELFRVCPGCEHPIKWFACVGGTCWHCGLGFETVQQSKLKLAHELRLRQWFQDKNEEKLERFMIARFYLQRAHPQRRKDDVELGRIAVALADSDMGSLKSVCNDMGLLANLHTFRFFFAGLYKVKHSWFEPLLESLAQTIKTKNRYEGISQFDYRLEDASHALGICAVKLRELQDQGLIARTTSNDIHYERLSGNAIEDLLSLLPHTKPKQKPRLTSQQQMPLAKRLELLMEEEAKVVYFDLTEGLTSLIVDVQLETKLKPENLITVQEFAKKCFTCADAVRRAVSCGFIKPALGYVKKKPLWFKEGEAEAFLSEYAFVSELALRAGGGRTKLSGVLANLDIYPVLEVGKDKGLVPVYRRAEIPFERLPSLVFAKDYGSKAGRKTEKQTQMKAASLAGWISTSTVSKILGMNAEEISALVEAGLLEQGVPVGRESENTRYFTETSVAQAKEFLDSAIEKAGAIKELGISKKEFELRFIDSGYVQIVGICKKQLIAQEDMDKMKASCKRFVSCATADKLTGSPEKHHANLVRCDRLLVATLKDVGYQSNLALIPSQSIVVIRTTCR